MIGIRKWSIVIWKKYGNFGGLQPFVWLGNIFGIFPCKLTKTRWSNGGILRRLWIFGVFGFRTYLGTIGATKILLGSDRSAAPLAILPTYLTQAVAITSDYFVTLFLEKRYVKFSDKLAMYDESAAKLGHPRKDRYIRYWLFIILTIGFAIDICRVAPKDNAIDDWMEITLSYLYLLLHPVTYLLSVLKFDLLVHLMCQRFRHLNKSIMPNISWTRDLIPKNMKAVSFNDVLFLHSTLLDASRIINETYGFIILCWLSNLFFSTVQHIYFSKHFSLRSRIPYYLSTFVLASATCAVCNSTADEANNAGKNMTKDEPTLVEDSASMDRVRMQLYLVHNRVVFSASDLFVINLPLFYSMLVATATYGILMYNISNSMS